MKREKILEVAEELFAEKGYEGTSVRDIAQKADVNIAMISYYFGSKEKLFEALIEYRAGYTAGILEELAKDESKDAFVKMDHLIDFYVGKMFGNVCFHNIMHRQLSLRSYPELKEKLFEIKMNNLNQMKKILAEGYKKKVFRKVDTELTVATIMGTIHNVLSVRDFYCRLMNIDSTDYEHYRNKMEKRLKDHLKSLMRLHLKKEETK